MRFPCSAIVRLALLGLAIGDAFAQVQDVLVPLVGAGAIATGFASACALADDGRVLCWGRNQESQLGTGDEVPSATAIPVEGLPGPASAVSVGKWHACAIVAGDVWCWGRNFFGELGDGSTTNRMLPVHVIGINGGATALAVGDSHSCAIVAGGARCWGSNAYGQVGDGSGNDSAVAAAVDGLGAGVTQISAGWLHTCVVVDGGARCWGSDHSFQIGDGVPGPVAGTPRQVQGLTSGVVSIAAGGFHTCAVVGAGAIRCWGDNERSQLGNDGVSSSDVPVVANGVASASVAVTAGAAHTCAVGVDRTVRCWGGNEYSQLAGPDGPDSLVAVDVPATAGHTIAASTRGYATCALLDGGGVRCWGFNAYAQIGNGAAVYRTAPVRIDGVDGVSAVTAGASHTCAVIDGGVSCWGYNGEGAVGTGSVSLYVSRPYAIASLATGATAVAAGYDHSCAVVAGAAWCWGNNEKGQLGDGTNNDRSAPVLVQGLDSGVTAISAGGRQSCAVRGGQAYCWGYNGNGELGIGTQQDSNVPVAVVGLTDVSAVSVGPNHTCAIDGGAARCWGVAYEGQLGDGSTNGLSAVPVAVLGMDNRVTSISAGYNHTCGVIAGAAKCWGNDGYGQLGNGVLNDVSLTPAAVSGLGAGVTAVAAGDDTTCAIATGSALCWGGDYDGDVGDGGGARELRLVPTWVVGLANLAGGSIAIGGTHACATTSAGGIACWGDDFFGTLGIGRQLVVPMPTEVTVDDRLFRNDFD